MGRPAVIWNSVACQHVKPLALFAPLFCFAMLFIYYKDSKTPNITQLVRWLVRYHNLHFKSSAVLKSS
jgi:hypothetical protein